MQCNQPSFELLLPSAASLWPGSTSAAAQPLAPADRACPPTTSPVGPPAPWWRDRNSWKLFLKKKKCVWATQTRLYLSASCRPFSACAWLVRSSSRTLSTVSLSRLLVSIRSVSEWDSLPSWTACSLFCYHMQHEKVQLSQLSSAGGKELSIGYIQEHLASFDDTDVDNLRSHRKKIKIKSIQPNLFSENKWRKKLCDIAVP